MSISIQCTFNLMLFHKIFLNTMYFNPIPAEVLENQDMLGGVNLTPPPLNPMFDVQI